MHPVRKPWPTTVRFPIVRQLPVLALESARRPTVTCAQANMTAARLPAALAGPKLPAAQVATAASVQIPAGTAALSEEWVAARRGFRPMKGWRQGLSVNYGRPSGASGGSDHSGMNPNEGACGFGRLRGAAENFFAAVSDASSFGMHCGGGMRPACGGPACGRCIAITCVAKLRENRWTTIFREDMGRDSVCRNGARSKAVVVKITDACPANHWNNRRKGAHNICGQRQRDAVDVSAFAFNQLVKGDPGQIHMEWRWAPCEQMGVWQMGSTGSLAHRV
eukprot:jgi/Mesvir1/20709/Mv14905-RA.1